MILPWSTDAPVYHWPLATVGLIVVNTLVLLGLMAVDEEMALDVLDTFGLVYGDLNPLQWITSNFIHAGLFHLVGNMFFLWGFGLVIEGKIGWWKFLALYLGIGIVECAVEQTLMLGAEEGGSIGASSILFGLMAIAMVWAPRNELSCVLILGRGAGFDCPILAFGVMYLVLQIVFATFSGFAVSSEMLHLLGAAIGFPIGAIMVKANWVDCENWDLFAIWEDRVGKSAKEHKQARESPEERRRRLAEELERKRQKVHELLAEGQPLVAYQFWQKFSQVQEEWQLPREDLLGMIKGLLDNQMPLPAVPLMVEHLRRFPQESPQVRLRLAQVMIEQQRPGQALRVLAKLPATGLPEKLEHARRTLVAQAARLQADGPLEIEAEDW
jgi:membrane associated rhomboid family serine protease